MAGCSKNRMCGHVTHPPRKEKKRKRKVYAIRRHNGSLCLKRQIGIAAFKATTHSPHTLLHSILATCQDQRMCMQILQRELGPTCKKMKAPGTEGILTLDVDFEALKPNATSYLMYRRQVACTCKLKQET